jgi:activator of 2-hydroxyglutaryl-CoA dehydratase
MRSLSHQIDGALAAGLKIEPKIALLSENKEVAEKWLNSSSAKAKEAAKLLMKTVEEARSFYHA